MWLSCDTAVTLMWLGHDSAMILPWLMWLWNDQVVTLLWLWRDSAVTVLWLWCDSVVTGLRVFLVCCLVQFSSLSLLFNEVLHLTCLVDGSAVKLQSLEVLNQRSLWSHQTVWQTLMSDGLVLHYSSHASETPHRLQNSTEFLLWNRKLKSDQTNWLFQDCGDTDNNPF